MKRGKTVSAEAVAAERSTKLPVAVCGNPEVRTSTEKHQSLLVFFVGLDSVFFLIYNINMLNLELPEPIDFEWDKHNQTKIRLKHNITPEEAEQAFFSYQAIIFDERHSSAERRYQLLGTSNIGRILFVVFTIRGNKIRIISARSAKKKERSNYGKKT